MDSGNLDLAVDAATAKGQPYETKTVRVGDIDYVGFVNAPRNLKELYRFGLRHENDLYVYQDERYTFKEAWQYAAKVANKLRDVGIQPGDRVGIALRNYPEWIFGFMGITSMNAVAVAMNAWWTTEEMIYGIEDSELKLLFVDAERLERISDYANAQGVDLVTIRCQHKEFPSWDEFIAESESTMIEEDIEPENNATLLYTSGSTAHPKGVLSTHLAITNALLGWEASGAVMMHFARMTNPDATPPQMNSPKYPPATILSVPLFHVTGLTVQMLSSFRSGRKLVGMYKWDVEEALKIIEKERITSFNGVPTMSYELVQSQNLKKYDLSSLQSAGGGGAPMAPEQARQIDRKISKGASGTGWGMTETQGLATGIGGVAFTTRQTSCGRAYPPLVKIKAIDEAGRTLEAGQTGELCIWGIMNFSEYWNNPEATAETLVDGWVMTGDIGHLDDEGYVFITDRKKNIVIRGGENIGCQEVEAVLYELTDIQEACVFGVPDERYGESVAAAVHLVEGSAIGIEEVIEFAKQHLAHFQVPEHVWISKDQLPRTASEKIFKRQIRDEYIQRLEKEGNV